MAHVKVIWGNVILSYVVERWTRVKTVMIADCLVPYIIGTDYTWPLVVGIRLFFGSTGTAIVGHHSAERLPRKNII